jgi:hypothetical protein
VQGGSAADLRKSLDGAWSKTGDDLVRELDEMIIRKIVNSDGLRGAIILTKTEKSAISNYAKKHYNYDAIHFADDLSTNNTGYMASYDLLYINTDVMPGTLGSANSRLSWKAAIAHEIEGHRAASLTDKTFFNPSLSNQANDLLEEMQASLRAHLHGKGLSSVEKADLLDDALERFNTHKNYFKKSIYENYSFEELKQVLWLIKN